MKKVKFMLFCLKVVLLCHWHPLHHGLCSEQIKPELQNNSTSDITEQQTQSKSARRDDETISSDLPVLYPKEQHSQMDAGPVAELLDTEMKEKSEKVDRTTEEVGLSPGAGLTHQADPHQDVPESSVPQEEDGSSQTTSSPVVPVTPVTASQSSHISDSLSSRNSALTGLAPCGVVDDSCSSTSISTVSSTAVCDGGESSSYHTLLSSGLPMELENTSTPGPGKGTKASLDRASQGTNASSRLEDQNVHVTMETDPLGPSKDPEDIPTFDEWKKIMMEVENEKSQTTHTSCNGGSSAVKKVQKTTNYASVECGAKILSSNPEAKSTSAILMENMDMYMLNPCSNKIWLVIELCQPIQVKQLDIANFELFSSTPKDFLVSISDRYPTSKWAKLGTFHARDERTVQSFPLDEHLYAKYVKMFTKYIKVELLSHFGSEHFCPLSLIRVFGTSMMEEYELNSEPSEKMNVQDEDYDDSPKYAHSDDKTSKNIIGSAKDAILNMVNNIASNVLGGIPEDQSGGNYSSSDENLTETRGVQPLSSASSNVLETMKVDQRNSNEISDTPPLTEDRGGDQSVPTPTDSLSQTPSAVLLPTGPLVPDSPEDVPIITLLPKEEGEESEDQTEQPSGSVVQEEEQRVKTEQGQQDSGVRGGVSCCGLTPDPCTCVLSFQEHLLQKCFPLPPLKRGKKMRKTVQQFQSQPNTYIQKTHTPVPVVMSSPVPLTPHTWTVESSSLPDASTTQVAVPPFPQSERKPAAGRLDPVPILTSVLQDLAPSLTSALQEPASSHTLASRATQPVDLLDPSAVELGDRLLLPQEPNIEEPKEVDRTSLLTSRLESTSAPVSPTKTSEASHEHKPRSALEKSSAESSAMRPSVMTYIEDQAASILLSTPTDQSSSQPAMPRTAAFTPTPVTTPSDVGAVVAEPRIEEPLEDMALGGPAGNGQTGQPTPTEFYAEMLSTTDAPVHGSNQKESVFMRLNNRIKALEVNMSLSGRYLEQLSQRYRKQMEEMQKAFNKTIIKLQNTSRMAEEQDQKQTESIQVLQSQLENVTQLLLNLSVHVSQLRREVSDRHSYLLLCLALGLLLSLAVCTSLRRMSVESSSTELNAALPKTYSYCCPERMSPGYEDMGQKRRASYPLTQSALQIPPTEGPREVYNVETQRNLAGNKKKKRCKMKSRGGPETITPTLAVPHDRLPCNACPPLGSNMKPPSSRGPGPSPVSLGNPPSEGSSEASSHSDEPSFCGITPCTRLCEGLPPPKSRSERRSYKRRRSKAGGSVSEQLLQPVQCNGPPVGPGPSLHSFIRGTTEWSAGQGGVSHLSGLS